MGAFLLGVEIAKDDNKIKFTTGADYSKTTAELLTIVVPKKLYVYMNNIGMQATRLMRIPMDSDRFNFVGFTIKDNPKSGEMAISFKFVLYCGIVSEIKTQSLPFRRIDLSGFSSDDEDREQKQYYQAAEAMNELYDHFEEFQDYVKDKLPNWLQMKDLQLDLFEAKSMDDERDFDNETEDIFDARKLFRNQEWSVSILSARPTEAEPFDLTEAGDTEGESKPKKKGKKKKSAVEEEVTGEQLADLLSEEN